MSAKVTRRVSVGEYAMLRNLESLTNSLMRAEVKNLRQLKGSWLWNAVLEQVRNLRRMRVSEVK